MQTLQQLQSGELLGTKRLQLACGLTSFPREIFDLAETLEILDLSGNQLHVLPDDFGRLKCLKIVFFSDNLFTELPEVLADCPRLEMIGFKANKIAVVSEKSIPINTRWLILTNNCISVLPASIGNCFRLQKCMLAGNQLQSLPAEMANCTHIELLRLAANQLDTFPDWLFTLPRLSWLAIAGNPCTQTLTSNAALQEISWNDLTLLEQLGEGASGIISKAVLLANNQEVAVKIFKGEVTSDGLPEDEMKATTAVGSHENIVAVLGKIIDHDSHKQGLVFELIPFHYTNLSGPPSFDSCTRDVFAEGTTFTIEDVLKIARGIASSALHLHQRGIMHGDLYAHNILIDAQANPLFGDFGGAMLYAKNSVFASQLERIEVRAFGCLLDDLLQHVTLDAIHQNRVEALGSLRDNCWKSQVMERPDFESVFTVLNEIGR